MASPTSSEQEKMPSNPGTEKTVENESLRSSSPLKPPQTKPVEKTVDINLDSSKPGGQAPPAASSDFPDGGLRAWIVVFGTMCNTFSTFGYLNAWGTFQDYYQQTLLHDVSPSNIAWIGSVQYAFIFLPGLIVGRMFDLGYFRIPFAACSALLVTATFLVPECKEYWEFLLCQGFAIGLACGGIFSPTTAVVAHWFRKKRGFALGLTAVGSSLGGTVFPIIIRNLIKGVGFPWTMRIVGFILIFTMTLGNLCIARRLPPSNVAGGLFNPAAFKNMAYTVYCISSFFIFLGLYTVLTFINSSAVFYGLPEGFAFYLVAIANGSSGVGRYICGTVSDRVGSMNVMIPLTFIAGVITYAWPFARSIASITIVAILYGFASGAYIALIVNPMVPMGGTADVGRRIGMFMTILGLGALCGPPISGAINHDTVGFTAVGYYAGSMVMVGTALLCITRHLVLGKIWGKF